MLPEELHSAGRNALSIEQSVSCLRACRAACASCRAAPHLAQGVNCFLRAALRGSFLRACLLAAQSAALNIRQNSSAPRIAYVQNRERRSCWRNVLRRRSDAATEDISSRTLAPAGRLITSILGNARRLRGSVFPQRLRGRCRRCRRVPQDECKRQQQRCKARYAEIHSRCRSRNNLSAGAAL